jgi:hypothetical protein
MSAELLMAQREIELALGRYARAHDERDWGMLDTVFASDVTADYAGEFKLEGRDALVANTRAHLGGCGPSQHLMGNFVITVAGKSADSRCYIRAFHRGRGDKAHLTYEAFGEYLAHWRRLPEGWRATEWTMRVTCEIGTRDVLGPE